MWAPGSLGRADLFCPGPPQPWQHPPALVPSPHTHLVCPSWSRRAGSPRDRPLGVSHRKKRKQPLRVKPVHLYVRFCRSSLGRSGLFPLLTGPKSGFLLCFRSLGVCVRNCQDCSAQRTGGALGASAVLRPGLPRRRLPRRRAGSGRPGVILAQRPRASPENALPWGSSWPGAGQALQLDALPGPP